MKSILIVEDVADMRELLSLVASGMPGYRVSGTAANVAEARREVTQRRPDLVLLDEILPGESSLDLLKELASQGIEVILLTGIETPSHRVPDEALGRLSKPGWDSLETERTRLVAEIERLTTI